MKLIFLITVFSLASAFRRSDQGGIQKLQNLIVERPEKQSKGLLEKPLVIDNQNAELDSDEPEPTHPTSWVARFWQNAFGRRNQDPFSETDMDSSDESEENEGFFSSLKPWWKGPNVCNSESTTVEPSSQSDAGISFFTFFMTSCHDHGRAYKCIKRTKVNSTAIKLQTLIYECCLGYARDPASRLGCPKKVELMDLADTLRIINTTKMAAALEDANLTTAVNNSVKITVFAPSDHAMTHNGQDEIFNVVVLEASDKMQFARDILGSHIAPGPKVYSSDDFEDEKLLQSANTNASIRINVFHRPKPFATANCARILSVDHQINSGGYVHVIDRVLTPAKRNLWQMIEDDPRFSVMRTLVDIDLKRRLVDPKQHLTVLAFTDDAFEALPADMRQRIRNKDNCFNNLLLHHVLPHTICTAAVYDEHGYVRNLANRLINATRSTGDIVRFAGQTVTVGDQVATNGVLHVIDGVILVPEMLDIIGALEKGNEAATHFASAMTSKNIASSLSNGQPATIFIPPKEFLPEMDADSLRNHIVRQSILDRYRVVLNRPKTLMTDAGRNISIRFEYDYPSLFDWEPENRLRLRVGCARAERIATSCNGVIVFLDKPISIFNQTAYDLLKNEPELSEFVSLIDQSGLADTIEGPRFDSTVLAPTNEALSHFLSEPERQRLLSNPTRLRRFVKEHILLGVKCCNDLTTADWPSTNRYGTMAGTSVSSVGQGAGSLSVGGARLEMCDLVATNGLIHTIDGIVSSSSRRPWPNFWSRFDDLFDE